MGNPSNALENCAIAQKLLGTLRYLPPSLDLNKLNP